jgi:hypothetical protein
VITQRVSANRRVPLAVLVAALALVGLLAWKPWDTPTASVPSPSAVAVLPTPMITPTPHPTGPPPTPRLGPSPTPGGPAPAPLSAQALLGTVECTYQPDQDGTNVLAQLNVEPPYVRLTPDFAELGVRRVAWRVELQINRLETVFSADWQPVAKSRRRYAASLSDAPLDFRTLRIRYEQEPTSPTAVIRVVVDLEAFGRGRVVIDSHSIVALSYDVGAAGTLLEGCPAYR